MSEPRSHKWPPREAETRTDKAGRVIGITLYRIYGHGAPHVLEDPYRDELFLCDQCRSWVKVANKDAPCPGGWSWLGRWIRRR